MSKFLHNVVIYKSIYAYCRNFEEGKIGGPQVYTMNLADYLSKVLIR